MVRTNESFNQKKVVTAFENKGFKRKSSGKHPKFILTDRMGNYTNIVANLPNSHKGGKGDVGEKILNQLLFSLRLGEDIDFLCEYIKCTKTHQDLLTKINY